MTEEIQTDEGADEASDPDRSGAFFRVLALAILWVMVNAWTSLHLGLNLFDISAVNSILAAFAAILAFLPESERRKVEAEERKKRKRLADRLLDGRMILGLYLVFFVAGSFLSSIRVEGAGVEPAVVRIVGGDAGEGAEFRVDDEDDLARRLRPTRYGGMEVRLEAELPACTVGTTRSVHPWRPTVLRLDRLECPPAPPTVDLRVPVQARIYLRGAVVDLVCQRGQRSRFETEEGEVLYRIGSATESAEDTVSVGKPPCWEPGLAIDAVLCTRALIPVAHVELEVPQSGSREAELRILDDEQERERWENVCRIPFAR